MLNVDLAQRAQGKGGSGDSPQRRPARHCLAAFRFVLRVLLALPLSKRLSPPSGHSVPLVSTLVLRKAPSPRLHPYARTYIPILASFGGQPATCRIHTDADKYTARRVAKRIPLGATPMVPSTLRTQGHVPSHLPRVPPFLRSRTLNPCMG